MHPSSSRSSRSQGAKPRRTFNRSRRGDTLSQHVLLAHSENLTEFWTRDTTTQRLKETRCHVCQVLCKSGNGKQLHAAVRKPACLCNPRRSTFAERFRPLLPSAGLEDQGTKTAR